MVCGREYQDRSPTPSPSQPWSLIQQVSPSGHRPLDGTDLEGGSAQSPSAPKPCPR